MTNVASMLVPIAMLTVGAASFAAGEAAEGEKASEQPSYPVPLSLYRVHGPCLPYAVCVAQRWGNRWKPKRPLAPDEATQAEPAIWGTTGSPWGYIRRLPSPTPESQIQPRYRGASTIRQGFDESPIPVLP